MATKKPSTSQAAAAAAQSQAAAHTVEKREVEIRTSDLEFVREKETVPVWADVIKIILREDIPIATLVFYSTLPDEMINLEVARFQTSHQHLKDIVNVLCRNLHYYPEKPENPDEKS